MHRSIRVQREDFSIDAEWHAARQRAGGSGGAIVAFGGLVRDRVEQAEVHGLVLEHYPGMTESSIERIVDEAGSRWSLLDVVVIHRIGELRSTDQIVLVVVTSGHRPDAFAACEFIMDYLKTRAVFWKRELRSDGDRWIESTQDDQRRAASWADDEADV